MPDVGLTHVALAVTNLQKSVEFYQRYARMRIVHERADVAWLSDETRPFVIVLVAADDAGSPLGPFSHLGVAFESREEMDRLIGQAQEDGCLVREPTDSGPPVGYWAFLRDPDGHMLELSYGQEVGRTVCESSSS